MIAIADTNALYRLLDPRLSGHEAHKKALGSISHLIISPMVLAELDYLIAARAGAEKAVVAARFVERNVATRRFEVPSVSDQLSAAIAVAEGYRDADGGKGVGLTDAMNVALAATYRTEAMFTSDSHFRMIRPLTGHKAFRLLPEDL
ncbi:PIN domain-containing protein [Streptomyces sp. NPDC004684]|uniref:PIN domain-containing protein n=1 Tax=unclassified Streptomyces TaxID=2593676 RepID=UPI0013ABEBD5|nr:PIN domain-containing protein [Streptomyces sp. SID8499]MYS45478.1 PIN domain-containing protein [Streptomyces sp. SID5998]MYX46638.1 PIN domain-containing protein [Streptomyces sp. SID89]NED33351.1 PIN domain-containing protein [Streptomyces sp. SID8499]NED78340.1 PIN domain-containing protein [Streptomyces sp. SID9944]